MKRNPVPSPAEHPNAYAAFSVGSVASLLVYECKTRLGFDLTIQEALFIVSAVTALALFVGKKVQPKQ